MSVDINASVDVLGISKAISDAVHSGQDRASFVKNLMESTFYEAGQQYNVMVFNLGQNYDDRFQGVKFYGSAQYQNLIFGIWAFESGEFTNQGDGGWINWAFRGWFDRHDKHVIFHKP